MTSHPVPASRTAPFAPTITFFVLLALVDLIFISIHVMHVWSPWFPGWHFSLESDAGLAAIYQDIKEVWLAACLALAFVQTRARVFVGWTLFFGFLLLDDALELHEHGGAILGAAWNLPALLGLRPSDLGEIIVAAAVGFIALSMVVIVFRRGDRDARQISADLMCLLVALAIFGVFFDALHTVTYFKAPLIAQVFSLIEDGGEMLVISLTAAYAFDLASSAGRPRIGVWSRVRAAVLRS